MSLVGSTTLNYRHENGRVPKQRSNWARGRFRAADVVQSNAVWRYARRWQIPIFYWHVAVVRVAEQGYYGPFGFFTQMYLKLCSLLELSRADMASNAEDLRFLHI